jgi:glycosyltransferase involved in cell wall biosynthesis
MKIRLLLDSQLLGGVETHALNLCAKLTAEGHDCLLVFMRPYPNNVLYKLCEKYKIPFITPKTYRELLSFLIKEKPDIIHAHGYKANLFARLIGLICPIAIVSTFHTGEKPVGRLIIYNLLDKWSSFLSNNIGVNHLIAQSLPSKSTVIPNFVDMPEVSNKVKAKGPYRIYFVGRISPEKGPLRFCQLSEALSDGFEWHMVGTGPLLESCQNAYSKTVHFHGAQLTMEKVWADVDLLVITSTYEGLPLVLLEAMSRGIPVVSFNVGSIREVITPPYYLINCFDLIQMQDVIFSHFLKPLEERRIMAEEAIQTIDKKFSTRVVIPQLETFYKGCIR